MKIIESDGKKSIELEPKDVELGIKDNQEFWRQLNELSERLNNENQSITE